MNERIKELMDDAVRFDWNYDAEAYEAQVHPEDLEYFAESIVLETIKEMSQQLHWHGVEQSNNPAYYKAIEKTLKHFGVEE